VTDRLLLTDLGTVGDLAGPRAILVEDGEIVALDDAAEGGAGNARRLAGGGLVATPGFIELQLNGADGCDFTTDPAAMWRVGPSLVRRGITAFLPTIITAPRGTVDAALDAWRAGRPEPASALPLGLHVEGPYLSERRRGAHDPTLLRAPDLAEIDAWVAGDGLRILTLAPELPGAIDAIRRLRAAGVVVSVGHTDADAATASAAIDAGARYATHLFNAMSPLGHRAPGAPGALLADDRVTVGLIVDGHHLDPSVLRLVDRIAGDRVSLVSDAIAALGLSDGTYRLGKRRVEVRTGTARLPDGTLAGSVAGLDDCVREYAAIVASPAAAVRAVTTTPARLLGLEQRRGRLAAGARADIVLLDDALRVRAALVGGTVAHAEEELGWG
jgi:N-acetylglucosamine-6-phosphate deacetylase